MATYKIIIHILPWEIDYYHLFCIQMKKSKYHLISNDEIIIEPTLNLSDYLINWNETKIPKQFFIDKFHSLKPLLNDYTLKNAVYEGKEKYGHLNTSRNGIEKDINYYINLCPDMYFSEHLLNIMIEGSKLIKNKYFLLTPEIHKMWDGTWDEITHNQYQKVSYKDWDTADIFDIRQCMKNITDPVNLRPITKSKSAGWFDLYNKSLYEELCPVRQDWNGYGGYDHYLMVVTDYAKTIGIDYQQWVVENQIIFEYSVGDLKGIGFSKYYKDYIKLNDIPNQREEWERNLPKYIHEKTNILKNI